jgi:hypothetical protein
MLISDISSNLDTSRPQDIITSIVYKGSENKG